ncbi:MAG TPA: hypothetical protein VF595_09135 [Tepidisphaeraceae bacterium]|jgi:hypothetical protein
MRTLNFTACEFVIHPMRLPGLFESRPRRRRAASQVCDQAGVPSMVWNIMQRFVRNTCRPRCWPSVCGGRAEWFWLAIQALDYACGFTLTLTCIFRVLFAVEFCALAEVGAEALGPEADRRAMAGNHAVLAA